MRVAKVVIEAPVTSFRYPHFLIGRQLTYDMPPPSTIYGHIAGAVGELLPPESFRFAYHFDFQARGSDLEHQHIITAASRGAGKKKEYITEATVQPHHRDFLFRPKLTLYLDPPHLLDAFRTPIFCVVLGRSQDLAQITSAEEVDLPQAGSVYFEGTILPFSYRSSTPFGVTILMPRYIEPPPHRTPHFDRYVCVRDRLFGGNLTADVGSRQLLLREGESPRWWIDPSTIPYHGAHRAVVFHSCASSTL